ncbi:MAG: ribonuclease III [Betaproteobacteria bacterium]|nr:ribonuclease III [Betaproteobacteria bacterium]
MAAAALESRLGYRFARAELLEQALTHRSHGAAHNERLEFLGDSLLGCVIAEELYRRFPQLSEGKLTRLRASLVRADALAELARELELAPLVRLGEGELAASAEPRPSILADALEALFGAVLLDGGYPAARDAVLAAFATRLERLDPERAAKDPKTELQEKLQAARRPLPVYRLVSVQGAAHRQWFEIECNAGEESARGSGSSRQRAEQEAARALLERLAGQ